MSYHDLPQKLVPFIWHFVKDHKKIIFLYTILAISAGFWGPFNSFLIKQLVNTLTHSNGDITPLIPSGCLIVINFLIFDNVTWRSLALIRRHFIPIIMYNVDTSLMAHLLNQSHQFFSERLSGTISKQMFHLIDGIEKILSSSCLHLLRAASLLSMAFVFSYQVNHVFCIILLLWSLFFFGLSLRMSKKFTTLSQHQAEKESILGGQIIDSITNAFSVSLFARKDFECTRLAPAHLAYQEAYRSKERYAILMHTIQGGLIAVMMAWSIYFLIYFYDKGMVGIGDFALILGLSMEIVHMMWATMDQVDELKKVVGRCRQSLENLLQSPDIQDRPNAKRLSAHKGHITFNNVTFHYKESLPLFTNLSITIKAGEKVGLVGYSGGGKSTFVNLILRLFDVTDGAILIDGQNIRDVTQNSLRENIAMIPQDPSLFHRSLRENIRYGRIDATDAEVVEAAKAAHAHEFIEKLPQGYEALVGERGVKLSGGQRQRIAIARAILKNAPILILDKATSQLDSMTENLIQESLWNLMQNKTTLVIAHRLSTLLQMDRILVFDKGIIVQDGTHTDLLKKGGLYKRLWDAQVGEFLGDDTPSLETNFGGTKQKENEI